MNDMKQLERLISASVSPYHCIMTAAADLDAAGFTELPLSGSWKLEQGHSYRLALLKIKAVSGGNFRTVWKAQHRSLRRTAAAYLVRQAAVHGRQSLCNR